MTLLAQAPPSIEFKCILTIIDGPDKGASYQLLPPQVTIGRGLENHVTLTDPRVSRHAGVVEISHEAIVILDVSSRDSLSVNENPVHSAHLKNGDVIQFGDTKLQFSVDRKVRSLSKASPPSATLDSPLQIPSHQPAKSETASKVRFYMITGFSLGAFVLWLSMNSPKTNEATTLKTVAEIESDIEGSRERQNEILKDRTFANDEERTRYEEAQRHYLEGYRDYHKGQYTRALRSFETARALDPKHELAKRYYSLAERQRDELIANLILEGRRYKEKNMFVRCSAAFEKVLDAIPTKNDLKYRQAQALKRECDLLIDERFR